MIQTYINGVLRDDIDLKVGGSLSETAAHQTSSAISVKVPVDAVDLQECDYIKLTDEGSVSGTALQLNNVSKDTKITSLSVSGNTKQSITQQGKNLFDATLAPNSKGNTTETNVLPGEFTLTNTSTTTTFCFVGFNLTLTPNAQYHLSMLSSRTGNNGGGIVIHAITDSKDLIGQRDTLNSSVTFTSPSDGKITIYFYVTSVPSPIQSATFSNIQLEVGAIATDYESFVPDSPSPSYPAQITGVSKLAVNGTDYYALPQTLYSLPDGTADNFDVVSGNGTQKTQLSVFDGSADESWGSAGTNTITVVFNIPLSPDSVSLGPVICDKFPTLDGSSDVIHCRLSSGSPVYFVVWIPKTYLSGWSDSWSSAQKTAAFKTWLTSDPVTVLYELSTPVSITGTPQSIPLQNGTNAITNDGGGQMDAEYSTTVHAGTIKAIDQEDMGVSPDLPYKIYDLTIASNADYAAGVFVDLKFPAGASMQQVLLGNQSGDTWYDSSLGSFVGIKYRLEAEGITIGTVDDFSNITLSEVAYLWGSYITDVLDSLADTAGAWWEITPDKVFNMRYKISREIAPFTLDEDAPVYDLEPSRDSYTMYSAVRVEGGKGKGSPITADLSSYGQTGATYVSDTKITLAYPIAVLNPGDIGRGFYVEDDDKYPGTFGYYNPRIGWRGIDDNNPDVDVMVSYGSADIDAVNGFTFPTLTGYNQVHIPYFPYVQIVTRLMDSGLSAEITAQRGGSGVIEYLLKDDSITDFDTAASSGIAFLKDNAKRARTVKFHTKTAGFHPGQLIANCNISYYGITGDYEVGAVTAKIITADDSGNSLMWEYEVEASNINYRDKFKAMFYAIQKSTFKIGSDMPAFDGRYLNNEIEVQTTLAFDVTKPSTAGELDALSYTAEEWEGFTAAEYENLQKEWSITANILTQDMKDRLARLLNGESTKDDDDYNAFGISGLGAGNNVYNPVTTPVRTNNEILTTYYIPPEEAQEIISGLDFYDQLDIIKDALLNQHADIIIDKSSSNPLGEYSLTITKRDVIS